MLGVYDAMRLLRMTLLVSEACLLLMLIFPPLVDVHALAHALVAYQNDPSEQNQREISRQREIVGHKKVVHVEWIVSLLAANTVGLYYVLRCSGQHQKNVVQQRHAHGLRDNV